jgi:hypothetical protein
MGEGLKKLGRGARTSESGRGQTGSCPGPWRDDRGLGAALELGRNALTSGASPIFAVNPWKLSRGNWGYPGTLLENLGVLK